MSGWFEKRFSLEEMLEAEKLDPEEDDEAMDSLLCISDCFGLVMCPELNVL